MIDVEAFIAKTRAEVRDENIRAAVEHYCRLLLATFEAELVKLRTELAIACPPVLKVDPAMSPDWGKRLKEAGQRAQALVLDSTEPLTKSRAWACKQPGCPPRKVSASDPPRCYTCGKTMVVA